MRGAERPVQVGAVSLAALEIHQPFFQAEQELSRFLEEHLEEPVVRHPQTFDPFPRTRLEAMPAILGLRDLILALSRSSMHEI
jgi:hypothetical protein